MKVLHIINGMGSGGAEKDIMNWFHAIDRTRISFDFLIRSNNIFYKEQIEKLGGNIFFSASFPMHIIKNIKDTINVIKNGKYDIIHIHANALIYIIPLFIAKMYKVSKKIIHIHNTSASSIYANIIHKINRIYIHKLADECIACSDAAGKFGFVNNYKVINNGMNVDNYQHSEELHKRKIKELNINENTVKFAHIGHLSKVKNQMFLIDIFSEIHKKIPNSVLMLIGSDSGMRKEIESKINKYELNDSVEFLNERRDVNELLGIFDMIIFPSLYEGAPLVPLEAQAAGTKVVCSDKITKEIFITPLIKSISLKESKEFWAEKCIKFLGENIKTNINEAFRSAKYDIDSQIIELMKVYGAEHDK